MSAVFTTLWVDGKDMTAPEGVNEVLVSAGFDLAAVLAICEKDAVKDRLKAIANEAIERHEFGAPRFSVGDEMFVGQDRL
ncbi:DsbA family protein [Zhongshania antarctica]|nr:DsbA family protein [Zhongshania antarctica]